MDAMREKNFQNMCQICCLWMHGGRGSASLGYLLTIGGCESKTSQASSEQNYSHHILDSLTVKSEEP